MAFRERLLDYFSPVISDVLAANARLQAKDGRAGPGASSRSPGGPRAPGPGPGRASTVGSSEGMRLPAAADPAHLAGALDTRDPLIAFEQLKHRLRAAAQAAHRDGSKQETEIETACFAIVAWVDTVFGRYPTWLGGSRLAHDVFGTLNAGDEFYVRLGAQAPERRELAEIFVTVMGLGFRGKLVGDPDEVQRTIDQQSAYLPYERVMPDRIRFASDDGSILITPQPYRVQDPEAVSPPGSAWWIWALAAAALLAVIGVGSFVLLQSRLPTEAELAGMIDEAEAFLTCHEIESRLEMDDTALREIVVTGRIPSAEAADQLLANYQEIDSITQVSMSLNIIPSPFCDAMGLFQNTRLFDSADGLSIRLNHPDARYDAGDNMTVDIDAPMNGYLHVAYFNILGDMVSLLPRPAEPDHAVTLGEKRTFGVEDPENPPPDALRITVAEPLGLGMMMAIATPEPVYATWEDLPTDAIGFLDLVQDEIGAMAEAGVALEDRRASYSLLRLGPQDDYRVERVWQAESSE